MEEWKTEEEAGPACAEESAFVIGWTNGHSWRCPPGEDYAHPFGLFYRVRSSREINWVFQRNMQFLEDFFFSERCDFLIGIAKESLRTYRLGPGWRLQELLGDSAGKGNTR